MFQEDKCFKPEQMILNKEKMSRIPALKHYKT